MEEGPSALVREATGRYPLAETLIVPSWRQTSRSLVASRFHTRLHFPVKVWDSLVLYFEIQSAAVSLTPSRTKTYSFCRPKARAYCSSLMAKPADKVEGNLLADFMDMKNIAKLSTTEVAWLKILAREVFIAVGDGKHAKAETKATTLVRMMQKDMNEISASVQFRPWVATFTLLSAFMHRAWSRHEMGKFKLALDDAVAGLEQVGSMMEWTSQLQGPIQYFKREKVRLLFIRSQCLKRLGDFEAALTDLRDCLEIIKSFDGRWDDTSSHLSCKMVPLVADHFAPISEKQVVAFMQIVMALQKVKDGAPRPHYSEEQRASLEEELGLSRLTFDRNTIALPKIVNNDRYRRLGQVGVRRTWSVCGHRCGPGSRPCLRWKWWTL